MLVVIYGILIAKYSILIVLRYFLPIFWTIEVLDVDGFMLADEVVPEVGISENIIKGVCEQTTLGGLSYRVPAINH